MNFSAILFRDINLLLKFIQYITVVFTHNNCIIRFMFFTSGSSDSLSDPQSWSSDSESERGYHRPWRHLFFTLIKQSAQTAKSLVQFHSKAGKSLFEEGSHVGG